MKWILRIFLALLVLVGAVIGSSYWWLDGAAKKAIEVAGADAMGVTVTLESINIGVLRGTAKLTEFNIKNPPGYEKPFFFDLKGGETEVNLKSVTKDVIEIPRIELTGITMYIEPDKEGKYNYQRILDHIAEYTKSEEQTEDTSEKHVKIAQVVLRDIKVYYKTKVFVQTPTHVKELILENVGSDGSGVNIGELISIVLAGTLKGVATELPGEIGKGIVNGVGGIGRLGGAAVKGVSDTAVKGVKKIFGGGD